MGRVYVTDMLGNELSKGDGLHRLFNSTPTVGDIEVCQVKTDVGEHALNYSPIGAASLALSTDGTNWSIDGGTVVLNVVAAGVDLYVKCVSAQVGPVTLSFDQIAVPVTAAIATPATSTMVADTPAVTAIGGAVVIPNESAILIEVPIVTASGAGDAIAQPTVCDMAIGILAVVATGGAVAVPATATTTATAPTVTATGGAGKLNIDYGTNNVKITGTLYCAGYTMRWLGSGGTNTAVIEQQCTEALGQGVWEQQIDWPLTLNGSATGLQLTHIGWNAGSYVTIPFGRTLQAGAHLHITFKTRFYYDEVLEQLNVDLGGVVHIVEQ